MLAESATPTDRGDHIHPGHHPTSQGNMVSIRTSMSDSAHITLRLPEWRNWEEASGTAALHPEDLSVSVTYEAGVGLSAGIEAEEGEIPQAPRLSSSYPNRDDDRVSE